jgi:hypothetical protein
MSALTPIQLDLLRLFGQQLPENDLVEIRKLVVDYLAKKTVQEADSAFDEKGYSEDEIELWRKADFRKKENEGSH